MPKLYSLIYNNYTIELLEDKTLLWYSSSQTLEDSFLNGIRESLLRNILILKLINFPKEINKLVDICFGKSFSNKFKYANLTSSEFIDSMLKLSNEKSFDNNLINLLSPIKKINHDDCIDIFIGTQIKVSQHAKTNSIIFTSVNFVKPLISFFTDASVTDKTFLSGYGITDKKIQVSWRLQEQKQDNNLAELKSIKNAILIAREMSLSSLEVFTDSSPAINFLTINTKNPTFVGIVSEILYLLTSFESYRIAWIPREKNQWADEMSKSNFKENNFSLS